MITWKLYFFYSSYIDSNIVSAWTAHTWSYLMNLCYSVKWWSADLWKWKPAANWRDCPEGITYLIIGLFPMLGHFNQHWDNIAGCEAEPWGCQVDTFLGTFQCMNGIYVKISIICICLSVSDFLRCMWRLIYLLFQYVSQYLLY